MTTTAYEEPDRILLCRVGASWQGTARNGGFFVVGDFADDREGAMVNCLEKYRVEVKERLANPPQAKAKTKVAPKPKPALAPAFDPLEDL